MFKKILLFLYLVLWSGPILAGISFSDLELTAGNLLSFNMTVDYPGYGTYQSLLISDINQGVLTQLTFFPEKIMYLENSDEFQIQNRFGVFRTAAGSTSFKPIALFPAFVNTHKIERGKIYPVNCSPDGKYLIYINAGNFVFGELTLFDTISQKVTVISRDIELSLHNEIALWSEDSQFFMYTKSGALHYFSIEHLKENRVFAENLRKIGDGVLTNVCWGKKNELYYVTGSLVYKITSREFFTQALYKGVLSIGSILGKIPFQFDPNFDTFRISPDGTKILLNKGGRNLFLYFLSSEDYVSTGRVQSLPYLFLPRNSSVTKVLWSAQDQITVLTGGIEQGVKKSTIFRLTVPAQGDIPGFIRTGDTGVTDIVLSPAEQYLALLKANTVEIRTYGQWELKQTITHKNPLAAIWKNEKSIYVAGSYFTGLYDLAVLESNLITLSRSGQKGFAENGKDIYLKLDNQIYKMDLTQQTWQKAETFQAGEAGVTSDTYRAYLTESTAGGYANMIMLRNIQADSFGTTPLFKDSSIQQLEAFPEKEEKLDFAYFAHGSRIRRREAALVINVIDSIEGLPAILNVLSDYNLKCTFFINGEAIKRYAGAVKEIAHSGHEVGSLFYAYFNMIDTRYNLDKDFIKLGLAINEDDYYNATGKELSLFWHAPYYFINSDITSASAEMGYIYIGRDIDTMDWVTRDISGVTTGIYLPAVKLIERILREKQPGSIIPVMAGIPHGDREDYLFQKLDLLINGLLNLGYDIVPVSTLIEHAR